MHLSFLSNEFGNLAISYHVPAYLSRSTVETTAGFSCENAVLKIVKPRMVMIFFIARFLIHLNAEIIESKIIYNFNIIASVNHFSGVSFDICFPDIFPYN